MSDYSGWNMAETVKSICEPTCSNICQAVVVTSNSKAQVNNAKKSVKAL